MDRMLNIVFISIRSMLDRDRDKYDDYIEKQSENGRKGWRPRKANPFYENPENPPVILETHWNPTKAKKADSDSPSLNPSDSLNDSVIVKENTAVEKSTNSHQSEYDLAISFLEYQSHRINKWEDLDYPDFTDTNTEEWRKFILYWTEPTKTGKIRARLEKSFEIRRRFATWIARSSDFSRSSSNQKTVWKL